MARAVFVLVCGSLAAALGLATALLFSPPGRVLLTRVVTEQAHLLIRGSVHIGAVSGRWLGGFALDSVVIRDTSGVLLAAVPRIELRYLLPNLLAGRIILESVTLRRPVLNLVKHRSGRVNYEEIFRLNEGPPGSGPGSLIEFKNLTIEGGHLTLSLPWNPDGRLRTRRQIDSALAAERGKPGRRIEAGPEGLSLIRTFEGIEAAFPRLRVSTPDRLPTLIQVERLATRISDPAIELRELKAEFQTRDDSLVFQLDRAALPRTVVRGSGRIDWPRDTLLYRLSLQAETLALADLRWVSPDFPDFVGAASLRARSLSGARTEWDIRDLAVGDAVSRVTGRLVAITDLHRGLGFRGMGLQLGNLDLDVVRPYLDTLPFRGWITGRLGATGFFDEMTVSLDWRFLDAAVPGGATSSLALDGLVRLGGQDGMIFEAARLQPSDLDLRTVRLVAPAVILEGRLSLDGTLSGAWKNVVFDGRAAHYDGDRPVSRVRGTARLDTRGAVFALETDVVLDSLVFDGIRRSFPTLEVKGSLAGPVRLAGTFEDLAIDADVAGQLGRIQARGRATLTPPVWGAKALVVSFSGLNLEALTVSAPRSALTGTLEASGRADSGKAPVGTLTVALASGRIREWVLDSAAAVVRAGDSVITVDTVHARWQGGRLDGGGTIGWAAPQTGRLALRADITDLAAFDSLAMELTGLRPDTAQGGGAMRGRGHAELVLSGALDALKVAGSGRIDSVQWLQYRAQNLQGILQYQTGDSTISAGISADSLNVGNLRFNSMAATAEGRPDDFRWVGFFHARGGARVGGGGRLTRPSEGTTVRADSIDLDLLGRRWRLAAPFEARIRDSVIALDTVRLATSDGEGSVQVVGQVPRGGPGDLAITALGVALKDVYRLAQRDTSGIAGTLILDAHVTGTARAPEFRGTAALTGGQFGDFQAPLVRTAFDYREQLFRSNLTFWRAGRPVVEADASLPLDLAFAGAPPRRRLPGPLTIVATGDSVDLAIVEAFTPNLRRVTGVLDVDARVEGSWVEPRLAGLVRLRDGGADVPALGVRYGPMTGEFRFSGDSIVTERLAVRGRNGELTVTGGVRLMELTRPLLALDISARDFDLIDVHDYLKIRATGDVQLTGTPSRPILTGVGRVSSSVIFFADLITKDIVNLEDPLNADLVDTLQLREQKLGASFQSRFLDSLTIRDLDFIVGDDVWLRSNEANFQLEGRLRVNKTRKVYRMDGSLNTPRGTYTLKAGGFINRTFTVERGTVRYFGDLNAELDVQARHVVKTSQGSSSDIPVIAHITGTLEVPKLELTSAPDRPPMSEPELISVLMLGTTNASAVAQLGTREQQVAAAGALALTGLTSELQRALTSDFNGILEIRPGIATSGLSNISASATQVAIGRAITSKLFVTANAGFCFSNASTLSAKNIGASLEYRFRRELRMVLSAEPLQTCFATGTDGFLTNKRYQFGAELRWDRDY